MRVAVHRLILLASVVAAAVGAQPAAAQDASASGDADAVCFGFAFGAWSPPLDWRAAGHGDRPDSSKLAHAPAGRDWAAEGSTPRDTVLMLYPAWWPVGVLVEIPARRIVAGDTVTGRASALVADGRLRAPTAVVRAWRVPCAGSSHAASPPASPAPHPDSTVAPRHVAVPDDSVSMRRRRRRVSPRPLA